MFASRANAVKSGYKAAQAERLQEYTIVSDEELKKRANRRAAQDARDASIEQYAATRTKPENCSFPLNHYVRLGDKINVVVNTETFGNSILGVIGAACVMVGVGTYDEIAQSYAVKVVEDIPFDLAEFFETLSEGTLVRLERNSCNKTEYLCAVHNSCAQKHSCLSLYESSRLAISRSPPNVSFNSKLLYD